MEEIRQLAEQAAAAMAALGSCNKGKWQDRKAALLEAGEFTDSGFQELLSWFDVEIK